MARVHILGGSGSGTSTLGAALAGELGVPHFDTDDFFWLPTVPRFREKRPMPERLSLLSAALDATAAWTLSGSLSGWGDPLLSRFTLVVYLEVPRHVRLARLREREARRYGIEAISPGGDLHAAHVSFLDWATSYDEPEFSGRSRAKHERWITSLGCDVLRVDATAPARAVLREVLEHLQSAPGFTRGDRGAET